MENKTAIEKDTTTKSLKNLQGKNDEFQLIAVRPSKAARPREYHEGIKAQKSDVHNWNNRYHL